MTVKQISRSQRRETSRRRRAVRRLRPGLEAVEPRVLLSLLTVNSAGDTNARDNVLTLREAIQVSNGTLAFGTLDASEQAQVDTAASTTRNTVAFNIAGGGSAATITVSSALNQITTPVLIDGTTQLGPAATTPGITLDGNDAISTGFEVGSAGGGSEIRGLAIGRFTDRAIFLNVSTGNVVAGNHLGVDLGGTVAFPNGDGSVTDAGVWVNGGMGNTIGGLAVSDRNIISGNNQTGIFLTSSAQRVRIIGNYIGTDVTGTVAIPNLGEGMRLDASPTNNTVGGPTPGARNIISGNTTVGITIRGDDNLVSGNYIGTDATGTVALPNLVNGIDLMERTADNNTIGGANTAPGVLDVGNLISGNTGDGIQLIGTSNFIQGNFIGTDPTGNSAIPNSIGISVEDDPDDSITAGAFNTIGGTNASAGSLTVGNLISGNANAGVRFNNLTSSNQLRGNFIGTTPDGNGILANGGPGIQIDSGSDLNTIGGANSTVGLLDVGNLISGSTTDGIVVSGTGNAIQGNFLGTNASGTADLGNAGAGVRLLGNDNVLGGSTGDLGNRIVNNDVGVVVDAATGNSILSSTLIGNDNAEISLLNGGNNDQAAPTLAGALLADPDTYRMTGTLIGAAVEDYRLQFFATTGTPSRPSTELYLGEATVTTDGGGLADFSSFFDSSAARPAEGTAITAIATRVSTGDSSTISASVPLIYGADIAVSQVGSFDPVAVGQDLTYTITVVNNGPADATGVVVTDTLPTGVEFQSATFSQGSGALGSGTYNFNVGTLAEGASATLTLVVRPTAVGSGTISNIVDVSSDATPIDAIVDDDQSTLETTVSQAATTVTLTSSANPSSFGQVVTFTATVSPEFAGTPTGTVEFYDGLTLLGTGALSGGVATFSTSALSVGSHALNVVYGGDDDFQASIGALTGAQVVSEASTTVTLTAAPNPSRLGDPVTFTVAVAAAAPGAGTPTDTVEFYDGVNLLGSAVLDGSSQATFTTTTLAVGSHAINAVYEGDPSFQGGSASLPTQQVDRGETTTTLVSAPNPSVFGQAVTFTATVQAGAGTPTGTVTFLDGSTTLGTAPVDPTTGSARFTATDLGVGGHAITARYDGDPDLDVSTSAALNQAVARASTSVGLTSSTTEADFGAPITLTATASAVAPGSGVPTGLVTFFNGPTPIGSAMLVNGQASLTTSGLPAGASPLTASFEGDSRFDADTSPALPVTIRQATSTTTLQASAPRTGYSQAVTFTATVSVEGPNAPEPTGVVQFLEGTRVIGAAPVVDGVATFTTTILGVGSNAITATYLGDAQVAGSSVSRTHEVILGATETTLSVSPDSVSEGGSVTLVASLSSVDSDYDAGGIVAFYDGPDLIGGAFVIEGRATITVPLFGAGRHDLTAVYLANDFFQTSASASTPVAVVAAPAPDPSPVVAESQTTLFALPFRARDGRITGVGFYVTVLTSAPGSVPSGDVTFSFNNRPFRSKPLVDGVSGIFVTPRNALNRAFTARYNGDANTLASVSAPVFINRDFFRSGARPSSSLAFGRGIDDRRGR